MGKRSSFYGATAARVVAESDRARGRLLIVTGTSQSGRSTFLGDLAAGYADAGWRVVRREVHDGVLVAPRGAVANRLGWTIQAAKVMAAGLQLVGGLPGSLLALAAEVATTGHMAATEDGSGADGDEYVQLNRLVTALEEATSAGPLALVVDDADALDRPDVWWDVLFGAHVPDLVAEVPLVCVLAVERSSVARGSYAWQVLDALLADGAAEEVRLAPLDRGAVEEAFGPVEPALADQLLALAQRRPGWFADLWAAWHDDGIVVRRNGRWGFGTDGYARARTFAVHRWVETSLRAVVPDRRDYEWAVQVLELGALEGPHFTAEVVAALQGVHVEDLVDRLDETLAVPDDDTSVLVEDGFVERGTDGPPRRYRFRSLLAAGALREKVLRSTRGPGLAGRYATELAAQHRWAAPGEAATAVVRLATVAGDTELVDETWARANRLAGVARAARLGRFLAKRLERPEISDAERAVRVERLNSANMVLRGRWDAAETIRLCAVALRAARTLVAAGGERRYLSLLVDALERAGDAAAENEDLESAAAFYGEAADHAASTADRVRSGRLLAVAGYMLSGLATSPEQLSGAVVLLRRSLGTLDGVDTSFARNELARSHAFLARALARWSADSRADAGAELARSAAMLADRPAERLSPPIVRSILVSVRDVAAAFRDLHRSESVLRVLITYPSVTANTANDLVSLGDVQRRRGKAGDAAWSGSQSLRLAQELGGVLEGRALFLLAVLAAGTAAGVPLAVLSLHRLADRVPRMRDELQELYGADLAALDDVARARIEDAYAHDRGADLVWTAFGFDPFELDRANAQLAAATPDLRAHLQLVADYAAELQAVSAEPGPSGT